MDTFWKVLVDGMFAVVLIIEFPPERLLALLPTGIAACLLGGSFGLVIMANLSSQRAANQVFPFVLLPQYFLAGVFNPIANLPWYLELLSRISPLPYAVDLARGAYYFGRTDDERAVLDAPVVDLAITAGV